MARKYLKEKKYSSSFYGSVYLYVKISTGAYISLCKSHVTTGYIPKIFIHPRSRRT
jgi:hypothetical protein